MTTRIKLRRDTEANWAASNPVLALGEPGYDTTNGELRIGDGTTAWASLTGISGGALSGNYITGSVIDTLQNGLPDWLEWKTRGGIYTQGTDFGSDRDGVWFANSEQAGGGGRFNDQGGEGTTHAYAFPLQATFTLANTVPSTVSVEFYHETFHSDHAFGMHLASADPVLTWNRGDGGLPDQVMFQVDQSRPAVWIYGDYYEWNSNLTEGKVYRVELSLAGTSVNCSIYDQDNIKHDNITKTITVTQLSGDYTFSFGADNDSQGSKSYYRNLYINWDNNIEVPESVRFTANAQIVVPGGMLIGNFRDEDYVVWAPEQAEYVGLWWGGDRGGNTFTQDGYGPNVAVQAGHVDADDANQQFSDAVPTQITTYNDLAGNIYSRSAEGIVMTARDKGWVFHENGNIYLPPGGTIRNENNVDLLLAAQGVTSDWQDGINDNVWRIVPMAGTKEFDYDTSGYKEVVILAPATVTGATGFGASVTDYPGLTDFIWNTTTAGNSWSMWLGEDYGTQFTNVNYTNNAGSLTFSFDSQNLTQNDKIVIRYYTEGTTYTNSYYNDWGGIVPAQTALATNTFTVLTSEFSAPWSDFLANATSSSVTFKSWNSTIVRDVVSVTDIGANVYEIQFSGTPLDVKTIALETISNAVVTNTGNNNRYLNISQTAYPDFGKFVRYPWFSTTTNVYTGGEARSGYVTIDGGSPISFSYTGSSDSSTGDYQLYLASDSTWTPASSVNVFWYREECRVQLNIYVGNTGSWNNGYKWLDWKQDYTELSPNPGNGIVAGQGRVTMKIYIPETQDTTLTSSNFSWTGVGYNSTGPYDPYRQQYTYNINVNNSQPFDNLDENGIVFSSAYMRNGYSVRLKVRVIYKFELTIGEDYYPWWC